MGVDWLNCEGCGDVFCDAGDYGTCANCDRSLCVDCYDEDVEKYGVLGESHSEGYLFGEGALCKCRVCENDENVKVAKQKFNDSISKLREMESRVEGMKELLDTIEESLKELE